MRLICLILFFVAFTGCAARASGSLAFNGLFSSHGGAVGLDVGVSVQGGADAQGLIAAAAGVSTLVHDIAEASARGGATGSGEIEGSLAVNTGVADGHNHPSDVGASDTANADVSDLPSGGWGTPATAAAPTTTSGSDTDDGRSPSSAPSPAPPDVVGTAAVDFEMSAAEEWGASAELEVTGSGTSLAALAQVGVMMDGVPTALAQLDRLAPALRSDGHVGVESSAAVLLDAEVVSTPGEESTPSLVIRVQGNPRAPAVRPVSRVCLVVDRSSSMRGSWSAVVDSVDTIARSLPAGVEIAVVVYGDEAQLALAPTRSDTPSVVIDALSRIWPSGGSNLEAGLRLGFDQAASHADGTLVVLVSDGVPNGGAADAEEFETMTLEAREVHGVTTSVVGIGTDFDASILSAVATSGGGTFRMTPSAASLGRTISLGVGFAANTAATRVTVRCSIGSGVRVRNSEGLSAGVTDVRFDLPRLGRGETRTFTIDLDRSSAGPFRADAVVAHIAANFHIGSGRAPQSVQRRVRFAREATVAGKLSVLDFALAQAMGRASVAVRNGNAAAAHAALQGYVRFAGTLSLSGHTAATAQIATVARLASSLRRLVPDSSWPDRRRVGLAMLTLSMRLGR